MRTHPVAALAAVLLPRDAARVLSRLAGPAAQAVIASASALGARPRQERAALLAATLRDAALGATAVVEPGALLLERLRHDAASWADPERARVGAMPLLSPTTPGAGPRSRTSQWHGG